MTIFLKNFFPNTDFADPRSNITFDIYDDALPIDESSINVQTLPVGLGTEIISNGVFQDSYGGDIVDSIIDGYSAKSVTIIFPSIPFGQTFFIEVSANTIPATTITFFERSFGTTQHIGFFIDNPFIQSSRNTETNLSSLPPAFLFSSRNFNILYQLSPSSAPVITARNPASGAFNVPNETDIFFGLHDSGAEGVNIGSLDVTVNGSPAIIGGFFNFPFTGTINSGSVDGFDGFFININPPTDFGFEAEIPVRIVVQDLNPDPASVSTLDITYTFTTEPFVDIIGPSPEPESPTEGAGLLDCIEFNWLDAPFGNGPDLNTLNVTLRRELEIDCITDIRDDIAVVNGVAAPGYELFATPIVVGNQIGFFIKVCPLVPFSELETVTVIVTGEDDVGNSNTVNFSISTTELTPPVILNFNPEPNKINVDVETIIKFEMHDTAGSGVDINSLNVTIDDGEAVINGVAQTPYNLIVEESLITDQFFQQFDGYKFAITRDTPYNPGREIFVTIDGYDSYGNFTPFTYNFVTSPDTEPPAYIFSPENGSTGIERDSSVVVDVIDILGVDKGSVNITVRGQQAIQNGLGVPPFDTNITEIINNGNIDGYRYDIDTETDFVFNEKVNITVSASDLAGNQSSSSTFFRAFSDIIPPTITGIAPRNEQLEVSLRPEIQFTIRDAYDVAFELTNVNVNNSIAVSNGVVQSGFSMETVRLSGGIPGEEPGDGYLVILTPSEDYQYNQTVNIQIEVFDRSEQNRSVANVSWTTINPRPPVFDAVPGPGDTDVPVDTNYVFEIFDDGYKVDINTLALFINEEQAIDSGNFVGDFVGTITEFVDGYFYTVTVDPRFILKGNSTNLVSISAREPVSGNLGELNYKFTTASGPQNPETLYIGNKNGVQSVNVSKLSGDLTNQTSTIIDGYYVNHIQNEELNFINRLLVSTRDSGAFVYSTNFDWPTLFYSVGDEIIRGHISSRNRGTLYLANRTRERVDVYYNILDEDVGRNIPDVVYGVEDGYTVPGLTDGYFTDMVVTENTSEINTGSPTIFLGTETGVFRIDTDESVLKNTEINGRMLSYAVPGSDKEFNILSGTSNRVVSIDVNTDLNYLYVATNDTDAAKINAVSYIDLTNNINTGSLEQDMLISRVLNDISFKNKRNG